MLSRCSGNISLYLGYGLTNKIPCKVYFPNCLIFPLTACFKSTETDEQTVVIHIYREYFCCHNSTGIVLLWILMKSFHEVIPYILRYADETNEEYMGKLHKQWRGSSKKTHYLCYPIKPFFPSNSQLFMKIWNATLTPYQEPMYQAEESAASTEELIRWQFSANEPSVSVLSKVVFDTQQHATILSLCSDLSYLTCMVGATANAVVIVVHMDFWPYCCYFPIWISYSSLARLFC